MRNPLRQIRQVRKIRISLAGKCQLLFGTAIVMILSAALAVPWHRIEQLTGQLNERAAGALAEHAIAEHIATFASAEPVDPEYAGSPLGPPGPRAGPPRPADAIPVGATTWPAPPPTRSAGAATTSATSEPPPPGARLVPLNAQRETSDASRFDHRALLHFAHHPEAMVFASYYDRPDGTSGYRYAKPLEANERCLRCHVTTDAAGLAAAGQPPLG